MKASHPESAGMRSAQVRGPAARRPAGAWLWIIAVLALALALRVYRLDAQSFWNDEGNSARLSERSLASITIGTASDIHPPLYYYALHFWRAVWGHSERALRGLSVLFGLLLVGLVYLTGRYLFDTSVGIVAALLAAVNPFQIYYSQEARMYVMLATWAALSMYCLVRIVFEPGSPAPATSPARVGETADRRRALVFPILYVLSTAAGLYTQYTFVFMVLVHNVVLAASLLFRGRNVGRRVLGWAVLQAAVVALYLPWAPVALSRTGGWGVAPDAFSLGTALLDVARLFAYGLTLPTAQATAGLAAAGALALAGLWPGWGSGRRAGPGAVLLVWWGLPVGAMFVMGLYREAYLKFLLMSSPAFCLLVGQGGLNVWRAAGRLRGIEMPARALQALAGVPVLLAGLPLSRALPNLYFEPAYARDDYRGMARLVRSLERPGDAVLLIAPNQWEVFTYYYQAAERVYPLARQRPPDPAGVDAEMRQIAARHPRLFVLYWGDVEADPQRVYESWLAQNAYYKASEQWWGKVRLALYARPQAGPAPLQGEPEVRFGPSIVLKRYGLFSPQVRAGEVILLELTWQAGAPIAERYKVFLHMLDGAGQIVAQVDREPGAGLIPTTIWAPGQPVRDGYGLGVPPGTPPGNYTLVVGLYGLDGRRLPILGGEQGDALRLIHVEVR